jgi:tetratricopeptide (TPR) repeat protein
MGKVIVKAASFLLILPLVASSGAAQAPQQNAPDMTTMTAAQLENAGDDARAKKDFVQAIDYFRAAIKKDKKNSVLYNKLGLAELKNNDLRGARQDFDKSVKLNLKYSEAVNNIGAVEFMRKNYGAAAKYFKKAVALEETRATFHVNLGAAWFSQKKVERSVMEYARALELDPDALRQNAKVGIAAQISSPEERAQYSYMLAKIYAKRGDTEGCLQCLKRAKEDGYRNLANVYKDEEFVRIRDNPRLHEVVAPPTAK